MLEVHFLNLSAVQEYPIKKPASTDKRQKLINWLRFIATDNKEERAMIATTSPILQMLNEQIDVLTLNPVERKLYESRMKLKSDIATISEEQFNAGLQEGKLEAARLMKAEALAPDLIVKITGLSKEEVEAIN